MKTIFRVLGLLSIVCFFVLIILDYKNYVPSAVRSYLYALVSISSVTFSYMSRNVEEVNKG